MIMLSATTTKERFAQMVGRECRLFSAPGRVNLIGEHTDYNDGYVLPIALNQRTYVAAAPREDSLIRCWSTQYAGSPGPIEFTIDAQTRSGESDWAKHIRGIATCLAREQFNLGGADLLIDSDLPIGAGLSSSAAIEVATGFALLKLSGQPVDLVDLALAAQRAEQEFAGTKCGIMDQYMACLGVEGHALLIDCRSLEYRAVPLELGEASIVICNTMVQHELASGEYNVRRSECEEGVRQLSVHLPGIVALRDVEPEDFDQYAGALPPVIQRRCNHVITEIARTLAAVEALERQDLTTFGQLMYASHHSLRIDYEVSCPELDLMVEIASGCEGVYGARMTGGGFGGSTVNLVTNEALPSFLVTVREQYRERTGIHPELYVCQSGGGVREEH
jgi:galactokinase